MPDSKKAVNIQDRFWQAGEPFIWMTAATLSLVFIMLIILIMVVVANGAMMFWPTEVVAHQMKNGKVYLGEIIQKEHYSTDLTGDADSMKHRRQLKIGNRDLYGQDFRWISDDQIVSSSSPSDVFMLERDENGNFYGYLADFQPGEGAPELTGTKFEKFSRLQDFVEKLEDKAEGVNEEVSDLTKKMHDVNSEYLELKHEEVPEDSPQMKAIRKEMDGIRKRFDVAVEDQAEINRMIRSHKVVFEDSNGRKKVISVSNIVRAIKPNAMSLPEKVGYYLLRVRELLFDEPREANTEGGLFPAIFGTIVLVFLMSILSFPLGVVSGVFLREYAKDGWAVRLIRISVNNLAGIPSIVYGVFGLGFFIYFVGGSIDRLFFAEYLPTPTFGTSGILWASLTLGLLTVPVVIVSTEEALGAIPPSMRQASLALGATRFQTLMKVLLPMASPGIMTGFILAMARAAGEVAPLMITGAVKLAPTLPIDGEFPYVHLERKFMHLGFHIYDVGFQSPNVEAARPMVYVTTLLLILIVLMMTSSAIYLRNRMREKFAGKAI